MLGDARRAVIVGAIVVFGAGFLIGLAVGRAGDDEPTVVARPITPSVTPTVTTTAPVATPSPADIPALPTQAAILREGDRPVIPAPANAGCQALITPGAIGECGEVRVAATRVIWLLERTSTPAGGSATLMRVATYVPDTGGWVEWLQAADPTGETWSDVNVVASDLTGDGVDELVVGFRRTDEAETLDVDIVGYGQDNLPIVLAHPEPAARGVVVLTGGALHEYVAQYPNAEPPCCPSAYTRQTIAFADGFFRITEAVTVSPNVVPSSQL